jgi:hypothetical protein
MCQQFNRIEDVWIIASIKRFKRVLSSLLRLPNIDRTNFGNLNFTENGYIVLLADTSLVSSNLLAQKITFF